MSLDIPINGAAARNNADIIALSQTSLETYARSITRLQLTWFRRTAGVEEKHVSATLVENETIVFAHVLITTESDTGNTTLVDLHRRLISEVGVITLCGWGGIIRIIRRIYGVIGATAKGTIPTRLPAYPLAIISQGIIQFCGCA